jgi:hypothetical protein
MHHVAGFGVGAIADFERCPAGTVKARPARVIRSFSRPTGTQHAGHPLASAPDAPDVGTAR